MTLEGKEHSNVEAHQFDAASEGRRVSPDAEQECSSQTQLQLTGSLQHGCQSLQNNGRREALCHGLGQHEECEPVASLTLPV